MAAWLAARIVALRMWLFARINGDEGIPIPGPLVDAGRFKQVYGHPAANGRSRGAALSDLFWYWLAPGPHVHQEHLEAGPRYDAVAATTRRFLSIPNQEIERLASGYTADACRDVTRRRVVRLRDVMMPIWAGFFYELVFAKPCPPAARRLIVDNADDVVTALKCLSRRHMDRRHRLTRYLLDHLDDVAHPLPEELTANERALYLQGTFFNTAVVQMSEAMAHLLLVLAQHPPLQAELAAHPDDRRRLDHVINETMRLYPLFGIAHRITTDEILVDDHTTLPAGAVLCFNYPAYHQSGYEDPERFDPTRWERVSPKDANFIPFGVAANRPCPAWHLAPIAMQAATGEMLGRIALYSSAGHTRSMPNRAPCILVSRDVAPRRRLDRTLTAMRLRDQVGDVGRSVKQLVFGTYMVWDARRKRLCARHFADTVAATARCRGTSTQPDHQRLFPGPLLDALARDPDRTAFEQADHRLSYRELLGAVRRCAAGLRAAGLGPGSTVAVHTALTPEGFTVHIAAHAVGCRVAAIRPAWSAAQLAGVLGDGTDALVGDATTLTPEMRRLAAGLDVLAVDDLLAGADPGFVDVTARPDDLARINFTSGSTGRPKGCAYTYRTLSLGYLPDQRSPELVRLVTGFDRMLVHGAWAMPVMFTFAGRCLLRGGTVVIADEVGGRPILPFALERHRITGVAMTPPMLHQMLTVLCHQPADLSSLQALVVTGSPASAELLTAATERLGPVVWHGYGQAETGMISLLPPEQIDIVSSSVGTPLPDVEIRVEAPHGQAAGEIHVRTPYRMAHYWGERDETTAVMPGGWLNTQDVGWLDGAGRLHLTGRSRDVILVNGEVCYAAAIERALCTHSAVAQAHVVGAPDERTGEAVHAFIVPVDDSTPPPHNELAAVVRAELTAAHVPTTLNVLERIPLAPGGKPDKLALAALIHTQQRS